LPKAFNRVKVKVEVNTVFLGLGSNIYPKAGNLSAALVNLSSLLNIIAVSSVYKSQSLLLDYQPYYFNIVVKATTFIDPYQLLSFCKTIEKTMHRDTPYRWGPRNIDIDIIDFNNEIIESKTLVLPHKGVSNRNFVLLPLMEIEPAYIHPVSHICVEKIYDLLDNHSEIYCLGELKWR